MSTFTDSDKYAEREAAAEHRLNELQAELFEARLLLTPPKTDTRTASMPSVVPYEKDDTRGTIPPWSFAGFATTKTTTTLAYTFA